LLLGLAAQRAEAAGLSVRFEAADAQTADFAVLGGGAFDAAFSRFGVMFFADPVAAFANIRKAVKPGGRLAFVCWRPPEENPLMTAPMKAVAHLLPPQPPSDPTGPGPFAFKDPERVRAILGEAGFTAVAIRPFDARVGGWTPQEAMVVAQRVGPLGGLLRENPDLRPKVLETVAQVIASHADADGKVRMGAAVWIVTATAP
jgi:SAM-dependent methyltransferase